MQRLAHLLERQCGVISRGQALTLGWTDADLRREVRRSTWQRLHPGVYLTHLGPISFAERVWAALLHAGDGAVASGRTAARLQGLVDEDPAVVEMTVPHAHRVTAQPRVRVSHSRHLSRRRHPSSSIPQTRVEETVLDLVDRADADTEVVALVLRACQRRLTSPARLAAAARQRRRLRHRRLLAELVDEVRDGVASPLERRYRSRVEVAHGLPRAERGGAWLSLDGHRRYFDVRYRGWRVRVELEGLAYHPADRSWRDHERDNAAVLVGDVVLRYGWRPVHAEACLVASQVAAVLTLRGWTGRLRRCGPECRARP